MSRLEGYLCWGLESVNEVDVGENEGEQTLVTFGANSWHSAGLVTGNWMWRQKGHVIRDSCYGALQQCYQVGYHLQAHGLLIADSRANVDNVWGLAPILSKPFENHQWLLQMTVVSFYKEKEAFLKHVVLVNKQKCWTEILSTSNQQISPDTHKRTGRNSGGWLIKSQLFTKVLPHLRQIICPNMADICIFQDGVRGGTPSPSPRFVRLCWHHL